MILQDISLELQAGNWKAVKGLVQEALDQGIEARVILEEGLLAGMAVVGEKFKNNEIFVPEVLVSARAMNRGAAMLKDHLSQDEVSAKGRVCLGTVQGDLHDIGKNLVKLMLESKGLEVIDLGTDVPPAEFVKTAIDQKCQVICLSALLTTTMPVMQDVIRELGAAGARDAIKVIIGGAPVTQSFADQIGADAYAADASTAADVALSFC